MVNYKTSFDRKKKGTQKPKKFKLSEITKIIWGYRKATPIVERRI